MKVATLAISLLALVPCAAQQSLLKDFKPKYRISEAETISVHELQQRTQSKARGSFESAKLAAKAGKHAQAIKMFEKALKVDPVFADARNDLAVELVVVGDTVRAADELQKLIQLDPRFVMAYTNLGVLLCNDKKFSDAELTVRSALKMDPSSTKANLLLAIALYGQGKRGAETQNALTAAARSSPLAVKLLNDWFGVSDIAAVAPPK